MKAIREPRIQLDDVGAGSQADEVMRARHLHTLHDLAVRLGAPSIQAIGLAEREDAGNFVHGSAARRRELRVPARHLHADVVKQFGAEDGGPSANGGVVAGEAAAARGRDR